MLNVDVLRKTTRRQRLGILTVSAGLFSVCTFLLLQNVIASEVSLGTPPLPLVVEAEQIGIPVHIKISSIALDAPIEQVGLTTTGAMDVPKDPQNAGWYQLGARPGQAGSAAIAGHVDWWDNTTGVFADLDQVRPGDAITIQDASGKDIVFIVRELRKFDPTADSTEVFSSNDGLAHLSLITCTGTWNKKARQYNERLIVFAVRVEE